MPPSVAQGRARLDKAGKLYMQPLIAFAVSASVSYRQALDNGLVKTVKLSSPISMAATTDFEPPLYYAPEFQRRSDTYHCSLRTRYLASVLAGVEISMEGSDPLRSSSGCYNQHTKRHLHLKWIPKDCLVHGPRTVALSSKIVLISKTYYCVRQQNFTGCDGITQRQDQDIKLRVDEVKLGTRKCSFAIPALMGATTPDLSPHNFLLVLPILSNSIVPPTFTTSNATRSYTLRVVVKFQGYIHSALALEAPIQVNQCWEMKNLDTASLRLEMCGRDFTADTEVSYNFEIFLVEKADTRPSPLRLTQIKFEYEYFRLCQPNNYSRNHGPG